MTQLTEEQRATMRQQIAEAVKEIRQRQEVSISFFNDRLVRLLNDCASLLDSDSQAAEIDRLRRGLGSIRDCTPDMWACSMAGHMLRGSSLEDALAASSQYDTDGGFDAAAMRDKCLDAIKSLPATPHGAAYNNAINDAIHKVESLTPDQVKQGWQEKPNG